MDKNNKRIERERINTITNGLCMLYDEATERRYMRNEIK